MDYLNKVSKNLKGIVPKKRSFVNLKKSSNFNSLKDTVNIQDKPLNEVMDKKELDELLHEIPKVDIHRHLEGSIEPETLISIAKRRNIPLPSYDPDELKPYVQITDSDKTLLDFIKKFDAIGKAFTDKDAIAEITYESIKDINKDNIGYAELRFSPVYMANQYNLKENEVIEGVLEGVKKAKKDFSTQINLIMIVERQMGVEHAKKVEKLAVDYMDEGVVGLDLANDEFNYPPGPYKEVFQKAKRDGLNITVHAGEAGGAENVRVSVEDLKADRIGHGVRTFEDPKVEKLIKDKQIPLEMCPTSNVQTGAIDSLENHPLKQYYEEDIPVTVNTDDPSVSDITLTDEYVKIVEEFGFSFNDVEKFILNGIDAAFLPKDEKEALKDKYNEKIEKVADKYFFSSDISTK